MMTRSYCLSGSLALLLLAACDSGSKDAAATPKSAAAQAASKTVDAPKPAEVTPPGGGVEPGAAVPSEAVPSGAEPSAAEPSEAVPSAAEPSEVVPAAVEPSAESPTESPTEIAAPVAPSGPAPTATGAELTTPVSLGPDAEIQRLVLAHDVENRQPVDPATTFPAGQRVNLFIESRNEGEEPITVRVTWENTETGKRTPPTNVVIGTRKLHRTRAYRTMRRAGSFKAIVLAADDDTELAAMPFTVE